MVHLNKLHAVFLTPQTQERFYSTGLPETQALLWRSEGAGGLRRGNWKHKFV